ncbi:sulfurtransferase-like selenium metabolism protein YedF [Pisciglobus halotolerans]|uniref:Selenium metabolism protein YedF n=1 Tax=Pisciglobus halotolerans TaxID=745365 RepID=A0A1I3D5L5_9LACT|nr:sulfurtransferase-like selenium metabolism protein YedF [Pisciglobus halotolerans]SFH82012.1 selenium metabolism protein YedF [Pisciglobus halotolerans]
MKKIDAVGQACPIPTIMTKRALKEHTGEDLLVSVDNEIATQNLSKMAEQLKLQAHVNKISAELYEVLISSDSKETVSTEETAKTERVPSQDYIVVLHTDSIGSGNEELGRTLLKSFIFSLTEQEKLPAKMLFYNAGALLTVEDSPILDDLKALEEQGVEILTCGICVEFYGLKDKLAVGGITNMYRIVELESIYKTVMP